MLNNRRHSVKPGRLLLSTNDTSTSFASKIPTTTEPTGSNVIPVERTARTGNSGESPSNLILHPCGTGSDDNTMKMRVIGWRAVLDDSSTVPDIWLPVVLAEVTATLSTVVGIDGSAVENELRFADTLSLGQGNANTDAIITSPTGNLMAHLVVDPLGHQKIEITFDRNSSATACNVVYAWM